MTKMRKSQNIELASKKGNQMKDYKVNPNKTFENMVRQSFNSFAIAGAKGIISGRVQGYSPLYVYGEPGTGKSHLLQAIANEKLREEKSGVRFVTCEKILEDCLASLRMGHVAAFRQWYRDCRILLIDNIEVVAQSKNLQKEILDLLNALKVDGVPVVCSSSVPPKMLQGVEPKLVSALEEGMILEIEMPERHERKALITAMMSERKIPVEVTEIDFLREKAEA